MQYFGGQAYLAQSPQFYKQMAMAAGFDRVFEIGPVFRADPSFTSRHATEFTSIDVEMSWIDSHEDVMALEEAWLRHVLETVKARYGERIAETLGVEVVVPELPFPRGRWPRRTRSSRPAATNWPKTARATWTRKVSAS